MTLAEMMAILSNEDYMEVNAEDSNTYTVTLSMRKGRQQSVRINVFEEGGEEMIRFSTDIGPADILTHERCICALKVNSGLRHGCLAIKGDKLIMTDTQLLRDADLSEVRASITYLAQQADMYEQLIYGQDVA